MSPSAYARSAPLHLLVVVNANCSGIDRRATGLVEMLRSTGADADLVHTTTVADFARVWRDADGRRLVLVGGDGTVHTAVNLSGPARELALIPAGRANNIARSLGIPLDWEQAAELAANRFSSRVVSLTTSVRVPDSQCGMRLLHGRALTEIEFPRGGMDSETRHLRRCLRAGVAVAWVPIPAIYGGFPSSFRPLRDSVAVLRAAVERQA